MSTAYAKFSQRVRTTPQSEPIPGEAQVANNAGGFVYALDIWAALDRFLILGTEGGTYYVAEQKHTQQAAQNVIKCIETDGKRAVNRIVEISDSGRAPKNDPALFALALAAATTNPVTRAYALSQLPKVARIPTHLFHFAEYVNGMRGWGRTLKTAVAKWYSDKPASDLAYQVVKYQSRDGWSNKDLAILSHPKSPSPAHAAIFNWLIKGEKGLGETAPDILRIFHEAQATVDPQDLSKLIGQYRLTREMLPTAALNSSVVWEALLAHMPMTALIRNLGNIAKVGLTEPFSDWTKKITAQLTDAELLRKSRVHPLTILNALKTYASGHGFRGKGQWNVSQGIVDALDAAFYLSFGNVQPTNKNILLALDVSGSMGSGTIANSQITPREAVAALALITANVEPNFHIVGFTAARTQAGRYGMNGNAITDLAISPKQRLSDVADYMASLDFGRTDCALPMIAATEKNWNVDAFCIYTDNETWDGTPHPSQALRAYRQFANKPTAKLIVTGMTSTNFTIADPKDPHSLDVVGFDLNAPNLMAEFIRG